MDTLIELVYDVSESIEKKHTAQSRKTYLAITQSLLSIKKWQYP